MMSKPIMRLLPLLFLLVLASGPASAQQKSRFTKLAFSDEFGAAAGAAADASKWTAETGGRGWGNQELQFYTDSTENAYHDGRGSLVIKAAGTGPEAGLKCWYGDCRFTSARLITKGKFEQKYGRFEARIKLPRGQGIWPAFWMLGNNIDTAGWPTCGEIDILENIGREPSIVHGTVHGPGYSGTNGIGSPYSRPGNAVFADDFHVYAVEWSEKRIGFSVDGVEFKVITPADLPAGSEWAFDRPFYMLLNVAVGGAWPGSPDDTTVFPQTMLVDYVRVYKR